MLAFLGLNTVISLVYYARILKAMVFDSRPSDAPAIAVPSADGLYVALLAVMVTCLGFLPGLAPGLSDVANQAGDAVLSVVVDN